MNLSKIVGLVVVVVLVGGIMSGCSTYNTFTTKEEEIKGQWAQVENVMQRRHDLIPNLVETTKGFAQHEQEVFKAVADARAKMAGATTTSDRVEATNAETAALARLLVVVENYPQLKSDATFMNLMTELSGSENRIATERRRFNETTRDYNQFRRRFPANLTASIFGFKEYPYFESISEAKTAPKVDFGKGK